MPTWDSPLGLGHWSQTILNRKRSEEAIQDFLNKESVSRVPLPSSVDCCRVKQLPGHCLDSALLANWLENAVQLCQPLSLIWCPGGLTEEILCLEKIITMMNKFTHPDGPAPPGFTARACWPVRHMLAGPTSTVINIKRVLKQIPPPRAQKETTDTDA